MAVISTARPCIRTVARSLALEGNWPTAPVIYQIYPRSFLDTTGSGVGDLAGITEKLHVIAELGVDAIWVSPFYTSPLADGGYDIVDHCAVDPRFGTMADFDALLARAHDLGLRVMLDQVLNHTSDQHAHFQAAIAGDEEAAARYVWRDAKPDGTAPNNWFTQFGEPAWSWNHKRRQYYMHQFLRQQASLDLRCEAVQETHAQCLQFWLDRGVDGFRFDVVTAFLFDPSLKDNPPASAEVQEAAQGDDFLRYTHQDHVYDILPGDGAAYMEKLRAWTGPDVYLLGESTVGNASLSLAMDFTEKGRLDACYTTDLPENGADAATLARIFDAGVDLQRLPGWLTSHDQPRHLSDAVDAKFYAVLMGVLPGPWLVYQGEELGLTQPDLPRDAVTDPFDLMYWPDGPGREGPRVPLPWTPSAPGYGFTQGKPWLPMAWPGAQARAGTDGAGTATFYAGVMALRRRLGWDQAQVSAHHAAGDVLTFELESAQGRYRVVVNYGMQPVAAPEGRVVLASGPVTDNVPRRTAAVLEA